MENFTPEQARLLRGFSQERMAAEMGIHENTYISKEKGMTRFYLDEAYRFCEIVEMPMEQISFLKSPKSDTSK